MSSPLPGHHTRPKVHVKIGVKVGGGDGGKEERRTGGRETEEGGGAGGGGVECGSGGHHADMEIP